MSTQITIEQIEKLWAIDSVIDRTNIAEDSSKQLQLHSKYHKILNFVRKRVRILNAERAKLIHLKSDYYTNQLAPQQMKQLGWEPNRRIVIKSELDRFLEADQDIIDINLQIGEYNDMVEFVNSIIKSIYQKPFITKNIIENQKFLNGIN